MVIQPPNDPGESNAMFREIQRQQTRTGVRNIFLAQERAFLRPKQPDRIMPGENVDRFLTIISTQQNVGQRGRAMLESGLANIGLASTLDDDGYEQKPPNADLLEDEFVRQGARAILIAQARLIDPQSPTITVSDDDADVLVGVLNEHSETGKSGRDSIRKGLKQVGLSRYMDDD